MSTIMYLKIAEYNEVSAHLWKEESFQLLQTAVLCIMTTCLSKQLHKKKKKKR